MTERMHLRSWMRSSVRITWTGFWLKPSAAGMAPTPTEMSEAEYRALVDQLTEHDRRYHVEASPTISDYDYDALARRLRDIEAKHPNWWCRGLPASASVTSRAPRFTADEFWHTSASS